MRYNGRYSVICHFFMSTKKRIFTLQDAQKPLDARGDSRHLLNYGGSVRDKCDYLCMSCGHKGSSKYSSIINSKQCKRCSHINKINKRNIRPNRQFINSRRRAQAALYDKHGDNIEILTEVKTSNDKATFKCNTCLNTWSTLVSRLIKTNHSSCPTCATAGYKDNKPGYLYVGSIEYEGLTYYKIGITNREPEFRLKEAHHQLKLEYSQYFENGLHARQLESKLHSDMKYARVPRQVFKGIVRQGHTEFFYEFPNQLTLKYKVI